MEKQLQKIIKQDIAKLDKLTSLKLPPFDSWPEAVHQFDDDSIHALKAALAARRPLLLTRRSRDRQKPVGQGSGHCA